MNLRPGVTIIVPAYNAEATLGECLAALNGAREPGDELILYDDGSTDATDAIARASGARLFRNAAGPSGPANGRNSAALQARCGRLLFVDADVILHRDAVGLLSDAMDSTGAVGAFGSYDDQPRSRRATSLYANLRHHFTHQRGRRMATTFWSGIGMIERDAFLAAGGFDRGMFRHPSIEDVELGMRLTAGGRQIVLVPEAQGTHWKDWTLWRVWHTDIVRRALPWSRLIADGEHATADLNLAASERLSAVLALSIPILLLAAVVWTPALILAASAALLYLYCNRSFFGFLAKRLQTGRLLVAVAMHWCYHIYSAAAFAGIVLATSLGLRKRHTRVAIDPLRPRRPDCDSSSPPRRGGD